MGFEYLEHTGESWIKATGNSLEEAFSEGAKSMFNLMVPLDQIKARESRTVQCKAESLDRLFFEWLNALILIKDVEGLLFSEFKKITISSDETGCQLAATAHGEVYNSATHDGRVDVKAATFSELKCASTPDGYEVGCVLDI